MKFPQLLIALLTFAGCSLTVAADTVPADTVMLNEMIVTAIKQSSRLKELPVASTLVTEAEADRLNLVTIKGISDIVPNFFIPDYGSRMTSSIYVRGLGARMDQPSVGLNVDNVPFLNKDAYDFDIADIVSVEMLRGPQSTLYGRNTMGGQINITTLSPLRWQGVRVNATAGNGFDGKVNAGWYGLLAPDHGLSVSAGYSYSAGWFRNVYNGSKTDRQHLWSARLKYDGHLSNEVSISNTLALSGLNQSGYPYESVASGRIEYNDTCFYRRFCLNDGLTVRWQRPGFSLASITSFQYIDDNMTLDQDFLPKSYFTLTQKKREPGLTQEVILRGTPSRHYNWTAGAFGFYKHLHMDAPVTFLDYGIEQLIEKNRNEANPGYPIAWDSRSFPLNSDFRIPTGGVAVYHESNFTAGAWRFTAGLRLDYEHVAMRYHSYCDTGYEIFRRTPEGELVPYSHIPVKLDETDRISQHFIELLPKLAVFRSLSSDGLNNIYFNVSKGYKAGGYNTQMFSDFLQQELMGIMGINSAYDVQKTVSYKPEKSWNFELGTHLATSDGRLSADACVFYIICTDQQLTMFPPGLTTGRIMTNAGRTRSYGAEIQLSARRIGPFDFNVSYGYTDARFSRFNDGRNDYKGKRLPYAPANTLFGEAIYKIPCSASWLDLITIDVNARATGKIYWNESNTVSQPLYALLGASVTFSRGDCSLQLWGENLTDTKYHTFYFVSIGNEFVQRGRPLRFGATLRFSF